MKRFPSKNTKSSEDGDFVGVDGDRCSYGVQFQKLSGISAVRYGACSVRAGKWIVKFETAIYKAVVIPTVKLLRDGDGPAKLLEQHFEKWEDQLE